MAMPRNYFWRRAPFVKLLLALLTGIVLQWYQPLPLYWFWAGISLGISGLLLFFFIPLFNRYRYAWLTGILTGLIFLSLGALLVQQNNIRNHSAWFGHSYRETDALLLTLDEPPVEKPASVKVKARVEYIIRDKKAIPAEGAIICYFKKDSSLKPGYGRQILFKKPVQEIRPAGNPGGFDYKRYCLFQGITHQVYLQPGEIIFLPGKNENRFRRFIYSAREKIIGILRQHIPGEKETGLAEALLIGYKNDLDPSLLQAYARTGVVHIIAISGLHLGLIYWLLGLIFLPLQQKKRSRWLRPLFIIAGLWLFSLLAGAQASILRSALMFTCIVCAEAWDRKSSIFNSLAFSAFILLCINPFWLWDTGFQLSYAAVLSIVLFMRPVYNWFYIKNKVLDFLWKLNAVTLAAQVLTVPLTVYYFHQFPSLFLLTNLLAVPLSSIILLGEILLCCISFWPELSLQAGRLIRWLIQFMNRFIESVDQVPFSRWQYLSISLPQTFLFFLFIAAGSYGLLERSVRGLKIGLFFLLVFLSLRSLSFLEKNKQQQLIIYAVPRSRAIDLVHGRHYFFIGDSSLQANALIRNFHLEPARILNRISEAQQLPGLLFRDHYLQFAGKKIMLLDTSVKFYAPETPPQVDILVLSKNPRLYIKELAGSLNLRQVVIDGSVPAWKARFWKKDLDSLHIPCHDVSEQGAFVMKLN